MKRVGVVLSGCGVLDGSEIHETVLTLLFLDRAGAEIHCFAPDKPQRDVVNHFTKKPTGETRNVLAESARIARGEISPLSALNVDQLDAVIFPGGFGATKNLSSFAADDANCEIDPDVDRVIRDTIAKDKVVGAICISPVLIARALQGRTAGRPVVTIGTDAATAGSLRALGTENQPASVNEIVVDEKLRIVTTPAYMLGPRIANVAVGIEKLVHKVLEMA